MNVFLKNGNIERNRTRTGRRSCILVKGVFPLSFTRKQLPGNNITYSSAAWEPASRLYSTTNTVKFHSFKMKAFQGDLSGTLVWTLTLVWKKIYPIEIYCDSVFIEKFLALFFLRPWTHKTEVRRCGEEDEVWYHQGMVGLKQSTTKEVSFLRILYASGI